MAYTLSLLTTAAECDTVLKYANNDKKDLNWRKLQLGRSLEGFSENISEIDGQLAALTSEVNTLTATIPGLAEGKYKEDQKIRLKKAEYNLSLVQSRKNKNGSPAQLERELELDQAEQQLISVDAFIAEVTAHKATLA